MPAPSSNMNSQSLTKIEAKCEALHKKQEEEDRALKAETMEQKHIKEERLAEERRVAEEKKRKEAQRKAEFEKRVRLLAEKRRQEAGAEVRRKEKQKTAKESDELEEESEEESKKDLGPSVPKKRKIQEMVST